jgi:DAK2 domain fusion protein YloV
MSEADVADSPVLDAQLLRAALAAAASALHAERERIDSLNVYPVPDGDTGSNMAGTLREAVASLDPLSESASIADILGAVAKGALYGARGNSGVILSQALRGLASGAGDVLEMDASVLARGLRAASEAAYKAVGKPVEGTMLTVLRAAAEGVEATLPLGHGCLAAFHGALRSAEVAEERTIVQLQALRDAGVTDAGGEGVCVMLRAMAAALRGEPYIPIANPTLDYSRPIAMLDGHVPDEFGFCTEFVLEPVSGELDEGRLRALVQANGNRSLVLIGDPSAFRVHVHCDSPEPLLASVSEFGRLSRVKVEDMAAQFGRFRTGASGSGAKVAVLALAPGPGFAAVFEGLGATVMDTFSQQKPSAGMIAAAADALQVPDVIVLPNHKDVVPAAHQAAALAHCTLHVVPATSLPQGVAALLRFDAERRPAESRDSMTEPLAEVRTIEVTMASVSRLVDGIAVKEGDAIALVDGKVRATAPTSLAALIEGLRFAADDSSSLVTAYAGQGVTKEDQDSAVAGIESAIEGVSVEVIGGGQPLYDWIASIE